MPLDEKKIKLTAKERREQSDKILEEVYAQLIKMKRINKLKGQSGAVMRKNGSPS